MFVKRSAGAWEICFNPGGAMTSWRHYRGEVSASVSPPASYGLRASGIASLQFLLADDASLRVDSVSAGHFIEACIQNNH